MPDWTETTTVPALPDRPDDGHKGTFGTVLIVGGSPTMLGAPAITARAAFRTGAGLVKIAASAAVLPHAITIEPGATGILLEGSADEQVAAIHAADPDASAVLAIGPGLGQSPAAAALVARLVKRPQPIVLDADGLNLLAARGEPLSHGPAVLTPHPGEFRRLAAAFDITADPIDPARRPHAAVALARTQTPGTVIVLKGQRTIVTDGQRVYTNTTGNAALATAGTGDVLTGVIAALIAQHMPPFDAAVLGVHLHGRAAELWTAHRRPLGLLARDLADHLPQTFE